MAWQHELSELAAVWAEPRARRAIIVGMIVTAIVLFALADIARPRIYVVGEKPRPEVTHE